MTPYECLCLVVPLIRQDGHLSVEPSVSRFAISAQTIQRDLASLTDGGLIQTIGGGTKAVMLHTVDAPDGRTAAVWPSSPGLPSIRNRASMCERQAAHLVCRPGEIDRLVGKAPPRGALDPA